MTALAADAQREKRGIGRVFHFPVAANVTIYKGALVRMSAGGFAEPAAAGAGGPVVGVAIEKVVNGAVAGAVNIRVDADCEFLFAASSITQAMVGTAMLVIDDNTVDETSASSSEVGKLTQFVSTTQGWVYVRGLTT